MMNEYIKEIEQIAVKCTESQSDGYSQIMRICDIIKDLNKIVNDEIQKAYLKGRREVASELRDILSKKNNNNVYEIDMQMIDKISEELNREWS